MAKTVKQPTPRQIACRENGKKGGLARAAKRTKKEIAKWSRAGGKSTLANYGSDYFSFVTTKRKVVGRYRKAVAV